MSFFAWVSAAGGKGIRFPIGGDGGIYDRALMPTPRWDLMWITTWAEQLACRAIMTLGWKENAWYLFIHQLDGR